MIQLIATQIRDRITGLPKGDKPPALNLLEPYAGGVSGQSDIEQHLDANGYHGSPEEKQITINALKGAREGGKCGGKGNWLYAENLATSPETARTKKKAHFVTSAASPDTSLAIVHSERIQPSQP